jgi:hypothetical protein
MINRSTDDMTHDAEKVLHDKLKNNSFSVQVDESTDFSNESYIVVFVWFVNDSEIQENFFCCKELPETSTGQDMFNVLSLYLETKYLSWEKCIGICTDGAPSVIGSIRGFALMLKKNPDIVTAHGFIHREVLVSKTLGNETKKFLIMLQKWLTLSKKTSSLQNV